MSIWDGGKGKKNARDYLVSSRFDSNDLNPQENAPNCEHRQNHCEQQFDHSEWHGDGWSQQKDHEQRVGKALFVNRIRGPVVVNRTSIIASLNFAGDLWGVWIAAIEKEFPRAKLARE